MISITNNVNNATVITHAGVFHADDVFATVILSKVRENVVVARIQRVPDNLSADVVVYDIGGGKFDHHQRGGNGARPNGVPYASCGLLWKEFGPQICADTLDPEKACQMMDHKLIQGIDANDNGFWSKEAPLVVEMSASSIIANFNPRWDEDVAADEKFMEAVKMAETIFDQSLASIKSLLAATPFVEKAIEESTDGVVVFDRGLPWQDAVLHSQNPKARNLAYAVFPSLRGGWNWQAIPISDSCRAFRKPCPDNWKGQSMDVLERLTGLESVTFVHATGFLGACNAKEDTIAMAKMAIAG